MGLSLALGGLDASLEEPRDHPPADLGIECETLGIALVPVGDRLVGLLLGAGWP